MVFTFIYGQRKLGEDMSCFNVICLAPSLYIFFMLNSTKHGIYHAYKC